MDYQNLSSTQTTTLHCIISAAINFPTQIYYFYDHLQVNVKVSINFFSLMEQTKWQLGDKDSKVHNIPRPFVSMHLQL